MGNSPIWCVFLQKWYAYDSTMGSTVHPEGELMAGVGGGAKSDTKTDPNAPADMQVIVVL